MRGEETVDTTITEICPAAQEVRGVNRSVSNIIVKNDGSTKVFLQWTIEADALTTSNGFPLEAGDSIGISRSWGGAPILGITSSGSTAVRFSGD